jgi:hypothetical protein
MQSPPWSRYADPIGDLVAVWRQNGIRLNPGASNEELDSFESLRNLRLPPEFRQLYRLANGMPDHESDHCMLSLWSLDRIAREHNEIIKPGQGWPYILFADGMICACFYALRFRDNRPGDAVVIWNFDPIDEHLLAGSIRELALRYLTQNGLPGLFCG